MPLPKAQELLVQTETEPQKQSYGKGAPYGTINAVYWLYEFGQLESRGVN
ncbi:MAG: hypothetical protein RMJ19_00600 [Gemmatales bacterium]|nr:hypothetical protein [Gemmatales bacterium]MDW8174143.1 hypothetical protein [Gemmatales bacterium]MDW8222398.1 hypothetical protein [Gemmatales bacterium]